MEKACWPNWLPAREMNPGEHELQYPWADIPELGTWQTLRPGVHWVRMPLPFALDHINLWVLDDEIDGHAGYTLIDCGITSKATKQAWKNCSMAYLPANPCCELSARIFIPITSALRTG